MRYLKYFESVNDIMSDVIEVFQDVFDEHSITRDTSNKRHQMGSNVVLSNNQTYAIYEYKYRFNNITRVKIRLSRELVIDNNIKGLFEDQINKLKYLGYFVSYYSVAPSMSSQMGYYELFIDVTEEDKDKLSEVPLSEY